MKNKEEIKKWLDSYRIENYTINQDLTVDVNGSVKLYNQDLKEIPVQFGIVTNAFICTSNELTSLKGSPYKCDVFTCNDNQLTSLEYAPKECRIFICSKNSLTSLKGAPEKCEEFSCSLNDLETLEYAPKECEEFYCGNNPGNFTKEDVLKVCKIEYDNIYV